MDNEATLENQGQTQSIAESHTEPEPQPSTSGAYWSNTDAGTGSSSVTSSEPPVKK